LESHILIKDILGRDGYIMDINTLKGYLSELNNLELYLTYLKESNKTDNLTNIKYYFNTSIFISVVDFREKEYDKLFMNKREFKKYLKHNPDKVCDAKSVKAEKIHRIFLR